VEAESGLVAFYPARKRSRSIPSTPEPGRGSWAPEMISKSNGYLSIVYALCINRQVWVSNNAAKLH